MPELKIASTPGTDVGLFRKQSIRMKIEALKELHS